MRATARLPLRLSLLATATWVAACRSVRPAGDAAWCPVRAPHGAPAFDASEPETLAGTFRLLLVGANETGRGRREAGTLTLWVQDSARRTRGLLGPLPPAWARVLGAAFERVPRDTTAEGRRLASRDLDRPGGIYADGRLRLGAYDVFDGTGDDLIVLHAGPDGFRGVWTADLGIGMLVERGRRLPNPAGYFCARRVPAEPPRPGT